MIALIILTLIIIAGAFLFYASYSISSGIYIKAFCRKKTDRKVIALTFDDGPDLHCTSQVLDVLNKSNTKAAFFCIGEQAENHPTLIQRIRQEGHLIGNHSYSHSNRFPLFSYKRMIEDLQKTDQLLERLTGNKITLFRPPFGVTNPIIAKAVRKMGYTTIGWNIRSLDTMGEPIDKVFHRIVKQIKPGSVILLHDRMPDSATLLTRLLEYLQQNRYEVKRIDELFEWDLL